MSTSNSLDQGREAFRNKAWADAHTFLSAADRETPLGAEDLETLAKAAYLIGQDSNCTDIWARAHQKFLNQGEVRRAACSAFWLGMVHINRGEHAQGSGWLARAERIVGDYGEECAEQGFLLIPKALQHLRTGDAEGACELFNQAAGLGNRFNNPDLITLGRLGRGQALVRQDRIAEGTKLFDETMVAVVSDEVSPIVAGIVYCAIIDTCQKIYDLNRAQEWTAALSRWCDSQPDIIPYRGQCLVRRAEIMQLHGEWPGAMDEVRRACELGAKSSPPATGEAYYRQAELLRLQGKFSEAEEMFKQTSKLGYNPQPGLALLRLAQGRVDTAKAAISQVENENQDRINRSRILPAYIVIMLAAGEIDAAEATAGELAGIAEVLNAPFLQGIADRARGSVLLANELHHDALDKLHRAKSLFNKVEASYESARTQVLIARASRELGDTDTAGLELESAAAVFQKLGAEPDLAAVQLLLGSTYPPGTHGLTPRELEVLRCLATGKTNKTIANDLFISERTVDRHVSNILAKLDVSTRAAATAYAYEHKLI